MFKIKKPKLRKRIFILPFITIAFLGVVVYLTANYFRKWQWEFQTPVLLRTPVVITLKTDKILSPLPDTIAPDETWDQVMKITIDEFKDQGLEVTWQALTIFKCESGFNKYAMNINTNKTWDGGVVQANSIHKLSPTVVFSAKESIKWAKQKYLKDGKSFSAWVCSRK